MAQKYDLVDYITGKAVLPIIKRTVVKGTLSGWLKGLCKDVSRSGMRQKALNVFADEVLLRDIDKEDKAAKAAKDAAKPKA